MTKAEQYQAIIGMFDWEKSLDANGSFVDTMDRLSISSETSPNYNSDGFQWHFDDGSWLIVNYSHHKNNRVKITATMAGPQDTVKNLREVGR